MVSTAFGRRSHGFLTNEAVVIATETRTSAPVRILRDPITLCHVEVRGLYPCGEGARLRGRYRQRWHRWRTLCRSCGCSRIRDKNLHIYKRKRRFGGVTNIYS